MVCGKFNKYCIIALIIALINVDVNNLNNAKYGNLTPISAIIYFALIIALKTSRDCMSCKNDVNFAGEPGRKIPAIQEVAL